jgi:hypothetical protein
MVKFDCTNRFDANCPVAKQGYPPIGTPTNFGSVNDVTTYI